MFISLQGLARIHPFDSPNIIDHMIDNPDQWIKFYSKSEGESVPLPGPYQNLDVDEVEISAKQREQKQAEEVKNIEEKKEELDEVKEEDVFDQDEDSDEGKIFAEDDDSDDNIEAHLTGVETRKIRKQDTKDFKPDSLLEGLEDYSEFKYGSIRFQKEQVVKKQQVFKYLLRLCVVRCIRPDKVVPEIMRF